MVEGELFSVIRFARELDVAPLDEVNAAVAVNVEGNVGHVQLLAVSGLEENAGKPELLVVVNPVQVGVVIVVVD